MHPDLIPPSTRRLATGTLADGKLPETQGIVEVLGIAGVDGEGQHVAEILTPLHVGRRDVTADVGGSILDVLRISVRQVELGKNGMHLRLVVAGAPQHLHDLADRVLGTVGPLRDAHDGLVAGAPTLEHRLRYEDVIVHRAVLGEQERELLAHVQPTYEGLVGTLENLCHLSLPNMTPAAGHHLHTNAIAVHGMQRVALSNKYRLAATVGYKGVLAVALATEETCHRHGGRRTLVAHGTRLLEIVVHDQLLKHIHTQQLGRMRLQPQHAEERPDVRHLAGVCVEI